MNLTDVRTCLMQMHMIYFCNFRYEVLSSLWPSVQQQEINVCICVPIFGDANLCKNTKV